MAGALEPPPLSSPLVGNGGVPSTPWGRWLARLQAILSGYQPPSGVQAPTFTNSWTNFGAPFGSASYLRDAPNVVRLEGAIKSGVVGSAAFTLPVGFRPAASKRFIVAASSGTDAPGYITVGSDGTVTPIGTTPSGFVSLDGIAFPASGS